MVQCHDGCRTCEVKAGCVKVRVVGLIVWVYVWCVFFVVFKRLLLCVMIQHGSNLFKNGLRWGAFHLIMRVFRELFLLKDICEVCLIYIG